jgi:hypothetical protein
MLVSLASVQVAIVNAFREQFIKAVSGVLDPSSPHGIFGDSCPNQHCQTSTGWNQVKVSSLDTNSVAPKHTTDADLYKY